VFLWDDQHQDHSDHGASKELVSPVSAKDLLVSLKYRVRERGEEGGDEREEGDHLEGGEAYH